jgi:hypothetical protein
MVSQYVVFEVLRLQRTWYLGLRTASFKIRHASVFPCLPVEYHVDAYERCAKDTRAIDEALAHVALRHRIDRRLLVRTSEGGSKSDDIS